MQIENYQLKSDPTDRIFAFVSEGRFGKVQKVVDFQPTGQPGVYNLAFGDKKPESTEIDDLAVTNNGDMEKVLRTVVSVLYTFFDSYPNATVYATGSTNGRTRLYRMELTKYYWEIIQDFHLFGLTKEGLEKFVIGKEYKGFLVQRKFV